MSSSNGTPPTSSRNHPSSAPDVAIPAAYVREPAETQAVAHIAGWGTTRSVTTR